MSRLVLTEIHARYVVAGRPLESAIEAALREDSRAGAKAILAAIERRRRDNRSEGQRLRKLLRYETALWNTGVLHIAGVDEAGMSPLAGPVVAAAVIFAPCARIPGVDDSKKLSAKERERLAEVIREGSIAWAIGRAEVHEIDRINIYWAGLLAMRRAVEGLSTKPQHLLIDARRLKELTIPQQPIVRGDSKSASIAAASILAKTARDAHMVELDAQFPGYGFAKHKGYPVREHVEALTRIGACDVHRRSFAPVRQVLGLPPLPDWSGPSATEPNAESGE